jgi:hypothetical protein
VLRAQHKYRAPSTGEGPFRLFTSHFANCPNAAQHRHARRPEPSPSKAAVPDVEQQPSRGELPNPGETGCPQPMSRLTGRPARANALSSSARAGGPVPPNPPHDKGMTKG